MSALPVELTAGINVAPRALCGLLLFVKVGWRCGPAVVWNTAVSPSRLGLLNAFFGVAVLATLLMPGLFAGDIVVIKLNTAQPALLNPSATNLSQLIYLGFSVFGAMGVCLTMQVANGRAVVLRALMFGAALLCVTGLIDLSGVGGPLLTPFRTATYAMLIDQEILGARRITGLMPEASAFGGMCVASLAALYFLGRGADLYKSMPWRFTIVTAGTLLLAALSTSSTAFLGLAAFGGVAVLDWFYRWVVLQDVATRRSLFSEFVIAITVSAAVGAIALFLPQVVAPAIRMIDTMVLHKSVSSSYLERSMWNNVGITALQLSHGFGIGVGSTRVSSWPIAIFSATGLLGGGLMLAFLISLLLRTPQASDVKLARGAKLALIVCLVPGAFAGTVCDFNPILATLFGMLAGFGIRTPKQATSQGQPVDRSGALVAVT